MFIAKYDLRHTELLDKKTCLTCFTGFSPVKLDVPQPEEVEIDPLVTTTSNEPTPMTINEVTKNTDEQLLKPPAVMFTGLNPTIVKRYKQVSDSHCDSLRVKWFVSYTYRVALLWVELLPPIQENAHILLHLEYVLLSTGSWLVS